MALHHGNKSHVLGATYEKGGSKNVEKEARGKTSVPFTKKLDDLSEHPVTEIIHFV
jgi:hypothetical protein